MSSSLLLTLVLIMATATGPILTYTGQKNSKIRWLPRQPGDLEDSSIFATGSYDNKVTAKRYGMIHSTCICVILPYFSIKL